MQSEIDWYNDDWLFTEYELYNNRKIIRTVTCSETEIMDRKIYYISKMRFRAIIKYMENEFKNFNEVIDCDDGDDWVIEYFDSTGKLIKEYEGYTYNSILDDIVILFEPSKEYIVLKIQIISLFRIVFINSSGLVLYNGTKVYILFAKNNEKTYFFYGIVI